ncbi:MAG TPA: sigma-70 family RNA polymerase sigma factor [Solirubrobacterales bacterium]|nr:sigma-70 family RNA polymerase sigma factor [Solirubrobacterales bacterium]
MLGGTTADAGVEARSADDRADETAAAESRRRAATELIESHDAVFRRTARRYSICADDAEDAYQRALEILLTKAPAIDGDALVRWMQTVTKREALAVRRQRERLLGSPRPPSNDDDADRDPLEFIASESPGPNDRLARRERVARSGEALRALKPQEVRALTLKAQGYSYAEIGEITGWSYTKINRCMAEGRKRFLQVFADIEQGRRCEELAAALSAFADGEDPNGSTDAVEFHLRGCATCRAKLRAYRAVPGRVFDLLPAGPVLDRSIGGGPHEWLADRAAAAVDKIRETGYSLMARGGGGGGGGEATALATAGGTRGAGVAVVAKVLAICGATAAGGATCVATGVVDPGTVGVGSNSKDQKPAVERPARPSARPLTSQQPSEKPPSPPQAAPASQENSPPPAAESTPVQQKTRQFSFESGSASPSSSSSGGEFGGPSGGGSGGSGGGGGGSGGGGFGIEG